MLFGIRVDGQKDLADNLITEWNEIFKEPTRRIISDTRYYKSTDKLKLPDDTYLLSIQPMFPLNFWLMVLGLGIISSAIFGFWTLVMILGIMLFFMSLFALPWMYILGTKFRLKKAGYSGKIKYVKSEEVLREMLMEVEDES